MANRQAQDLLSFYYEIPIISRLLLTGALVTSTACFMDFISPLTLYYNYDLILNKGQYWRLFSSFFFFGSFGFDFLFHLYFVVRYCRYLEEGKFRNRLADFIYMFLFGATLMLILVVNVQMFSKLKFLGQPLSFMMVYIWSRSPENIHIQMNMFGFLTFSAPYLPWMFLLFALVIGNPIETDLLGILVGHIYYFLDDIYPQVAALRGWSFRQPLATPGILKYFCDLLFGFWVNTEGRRQEPVRIVHN